MANACLEVPVRVLLMMKFRRVDQDSLGPARLGMRVDQRWREHVYPLGDQGAVWLSAAVWIPACSRTCAGSSLGVGQAVADIERALAAKRRWNSWSRVSSGPWCRWTSLSQC